MRSIKDTLIIVLLVVLVGCGIEFGKFIYDARLLIEATKQHEKDVAANTNALLIQVGLVADNVRRASESQEQVSKKTLALLDNANELLAHTKENTDEITAHTVQTMDAVKPVLDQLAATTTDVNKLITDQNIPQILTNLNETSKQIAATSVQVNGTMVNVNKTSDHVEKFVDQATKPVSVAKRIFKGCLSFLGGVAAHFI